MSGEALDRKRVIVVTEADVRNSLLNIRRHLDFFPRDCIGPARRNGNGLGKPIKIEFEGLSQTIETDIGTDAKTRRPRS